METTSVLVFNDQIGIAPGTGGYEKKKVGGLQEKAVTALSGLVTPIFETQYSRYLSRSDVKTWLTTSEAVEAWNKTKNDESYCSNSEANWRDVARKYFWTEHASMLRSLFDKDHIPMIASVLAASPNEQLQFEIQKDLLTIYEKTTSLDQVRTWANSSEHTEEIQLVENAFAISALIRGRYHDLLAFAEGRQILHHPFRQYILDDLKFSQHVKATEAQRILVLIILSSALAETNIHARINRWANNIIEARNALVESRLDIDNMGGIDPLQEIYERSKLAGLRFPETLTVRFLDKFITSLYGTSFDLSIQAFPPILLFKEHLTNWFESAIRKPLIKNVHDKTNDEQNVFFDNLKYLDKTTPGRIICKFRA